MVGRQYVTVWRNNNPRTQALSFTVPWLCLLPGVVPEKTPEKRVFQQWILAPAVMDRHARRNIHHRRRYLLDDRRETRSGLDITAQWRIQHRHLRRRIRLGHRNPWLCEQYNRQTSYNCT